VDQDGGGRQQRGKNVARQAQCRLPALRNKHRCPGGSC
jgi:hypothetical protein